MAQVREYLTTKQLAKLLQLAPVTVYRLTERGEIPAVKVGGQWRFSRAVIDAWLTAPGRAHDARPGVELVEVG